MNRRIYLGIIALPICLYNAGVNFVSYSEIPNAKYATFHTQSEVAQKTIKLWQIAGREQQSEDCLSTKECKI